MNICIMEGKCVILRSISREKTEKIQKVYKKREVTEMKIKKIMAGNGNGKPGVTTECKGRSD